MSAETILYIVIAGVIALGVSVFMYGYKSKLSTNLKWILGILRFLTIFLVLLLLINPKFTSETYTIVKPKLPVLVDNSSSINELDRVEEVNEAIKKLQQNRDLQDKFDISLFTFGSTLSDNDSISFSKKNTNITTALKQIDDLFKSEVAPTVIITDGNQTLGADYEFTSQTQKNPVCPIIVGDSTKFVDLRVGQLNTNRYAFLKNQFPVEALLVYSGARPITTQFVIRQGAATVYRETVSFSEVENTKTINLTLPASSVGIQKYTVQLVPLSEEKNKVNNSKRFAVEVIDQATNVLVVSKIIHPDLGALKKSITSNEQRRLEIKTPQEAIEVLDDYQLIILYQPDRFFASVFQEISKLNKNTLTITGLQTDWVFLNSIQKNYVKEVTNETEEVLAAINSNYGTFAVEDIGFDDFPPLKTLFGELSIVIPNEELLKQTINGINSGSPMLATMELNGKRDAILDGEGLWKWRARSYLNSGSFEEFDGFFAKLVQYLASNKRRSRLEVANESFYYNNTAIQLSAQYFDKNFVFDPRASLSITVKEKETSKITVFPLLLKNNFYQVNLTSLPAGEYDYTVSVDDETIQRSGSFTILDFNVEQQFLNANVTKLDRLATNTGGKAFFISENQKLIDFLLTDNSFKSIQKSEQKIVPLIDWKYLLALLVFVLAAEWFIRKYNGLI
ncbi:VWA domain-containing protein [Patiriisocius hiemis]|uniref:VWA domain-containing protein n=1 Tax=Patiriisocius hiemis TaxID=3075604 RepID=A0ABU2Y9L8_9FLAO|nr:VWA domain-containing protein [Constantimarinum sp. W242]MDT0554874.1 VWA domain-containing protein [Constantimarinum sp. W242]